MRLVTFNEMVPGMVLQLVHWPNDEVNFHQLILLMEKAEPGYAFPNSRSLKYIAANYAFEGPCWSTRGTDDGDRWFVIDDQEMLDRLRAHIKSEINTTRDALDAVERFIDRNL